MAGFEPATRESLLLSGYSHGGYWIPASLRFRLHAYEIGVRVALACTIGCPYIKAGRSRRRSRKQADQLGGQLADPGLDLCLAAQALSFS